MGMSKYDELVTQVLNYLDNRDWDSAYSLLKNKELQGDAAAIAVLGEFYINGIGIPEDVEMGIEMLKLQVHWRPCTCRAKRFQPTNDLQSIT